MLLCLLMLSLHVIILFVFGSPNPFFPIISLRIVVLPFIGFFSSVACAHGKGLVSLWHHFHTSSGHFVAPW